MNQYGELKNHLQKISLFPGRKVLFIIRFENLATMRDHDVS